MSLLLPGQDPTNSWGGESDRKVDAILTRYMKSWALCAGFILIAGLSLTNWLLVHEVNRLNTIIQKMKFLYGEVGSPPQSTQSSASEPAEPINRGPVLPQISSPRIAEDSNASQRNASRRDARPLYEKKTTTAVANETRSDIALSAKSNEVYTDVKNLSSTIPDEKVSKQVISYVIYGSDPKYLIGCYKNLELSKTHFPGWTIRFYAYGQNESFAKRLQDAGGEVIEIKSRSRLQRFMVALDDSVDRYIIRDVDGRLTARDSMAVHEWIRSGKKIHTMRDHPNQCYSMNAGMWGGKRGALSDMKQIFEQEMSSEAAGHDFYDTIFVDKIYQRRKNDTFVHDSYCCKKYKMDGRPFPTARPKDFSHVGQVYDENDVPRQKDINALKSKPSPVACRGKFPERSYG